MFTSRLEDLIISLPCNAERRETTGDSCALFPAIKQGSSKLRKDCLLLCLWYELTSNLPWVNIDKMVMVSEVFDIITQKTSQSKTGIKKEKTIRLKVTIVLFLYDYASLRVPCE